MLEVLILLFIVIALIACIASGGELGYRAAYKVLQTGQHVFEEERAVGKGARSERDFQGTNGRHERRVTPLTKKKIGEAHGWRCACGCREQLTFDYHVDHIVPLFKGGTNDESNLQPLNPKCHLLKTSRENSR